MTYGWLSSSSSISDVRESHAGVAAPRAGDRVMPAAGAAVKAAAGGWRMGVEIAEKDCRKYFPTDRRYVPAPSSASRRIRRTSARWGGGLPARTSAHDSIDATNVPRQRANPQ